MVRSISGCNAAFCHSAILASDTFATTSEHSDRLSQSGAPVILDPRKNIESPIPVGTYAI
jgi:hypothetical protein